VRTFLAIPLLKDDEVVGNLGIYRPEVRPFTQKQIELVSTFADQAVIAIENVRLFNETKEALERQTATAEILRVIASSPTDVQPVFDVIVQSAVRLCGARFGRVYRYDGSIIEMVAGHGLSAKGMKQVRQVFPRAASDDTIVGGVILTRQPFFLKDIQSDESVPELSRQMIEALDTRSQVTVPMLRAGESIGAITMGWEAPGAFDDQQVALLQTFADQAVIAIENVRLFNETKEALERQTATADILKVIASSPADVQPVFDAIARSAKQLFGGHSCAVWRVAGETLQITAYTATDAAGNEALKNWPPIALSRTDSTLARAVVSAKPVIVSDRETDPLSSPEAKELARARGFRSQLAVPMVREGAVLGVIVMTRREPGSFSDHQVNLLSTFADQAVIAIENVRLFNETKEALERQTATAEVLRVISNSPTDTQPVFEAIAQSGLRLFPGAAVAVALPDGDQVRAAAIATEDPEQAAAWRARFPNPLRRDRMHGAAILERRLVDVPDAEAEVDGPMGPGIRNFLVSGNKAITIVPMIRGESAIGAISVIRLLPGPLKPNQVALLQTFADQAVIAIENVRLFNETKEALERQTATSEVLNVIARSPSDVQPVLDAVAESAARLCGASDALIMTSEAGMLVRRAHFGPIQSVSAARPLTRGTPTGRAVLERCTVHVEDVLAEIERGDYLEAAALQRRNGMRTILSVPLVREDSVIGVISMRRLEVRPFTEKQIALVKTFADQAVIAIENVRLFNETKESLERQTATAEILRVIASSPSDVQPVFDAIAASARRLLGGHAANVARRAGDLLELAAFTSTGEAGDSEISRLWPAKITGKGHMGKALLSKAPAWVEDIETDTSYSDEFRAGARARGMRSAVSVPMLREGEAIGVISVNRSIPGRFSDHQTNLLQTFADQAVIAIENVRLFNETKEALERQTATAEILKVISSSPTDVQPVFDAIVASGLRLFGGMGVVMRLIRNGQLIRVASAMSSNLHDESDPDPRPIDPGSAAGRAVRLRETVEIVDTATCDWLDERSRTYFERRGYKAAVFTPMLRERVAIGALGVVRGTVGAFSDKQLELLRTFANQAVIAIENARLFKELQSRTEALTKSVGQLTALGEVGQAISSTLDLETVLKTIVQRAVQLTALDSGAIYEYDESKEQFTLQAADKIESELVEAVRRTPIRKGDGATGRIAVTLEAEQVPDIEGDTYRGSRKDVLMRSGYRAVLAVPLLREDHLLGALQVFRRAPGPFAPEIVELLKTFATQSAMAIQNARLFREIAEKGKQLEEASKHKSHFLASMSHELRTPLNAILGFNEMILGDVYGEVPTDMKEPLTDIQSSGKHLLRLINNVLDLAKIEAGRMELALADYSVHDTVESVRSTLRPLAAEKGLDFIVTVPADIPLAYGDAGRITQCLMNLAGNSLKFTKAGKVEISVEQDNGRLTYRVADTGIGIPPEKIASLFTEFKQTDATIASEYGGTGLGLSISKKFIEMHGGRIWVESEVGSGSRFIFEVPLRAGEGKTA
jgi:GAF domain-containing protein